METLNRARFTVDMESVSAGAKLRVLRMIQGMSQAMVAQEIGTNSISVSSFERTSDRYWVPAALSAWIEKWEKEFCPDGILDLSKLSIGKKQSIERALCKLGCQIVIKGG